MTTEETLQKAEALLQPVAAGFARPAADRLDATVAASDLLRAVEALGRARFGYLSAITGLDCPPTASAAGAVEVLYHFCERGAVVTLRVKVPYEAAAVPGICALVPYATLYERELAEMLGVSIDGVPSTDHLLLPENWPAGVFPLRKSFTGKTERASAS